MHAARILSEINVLGRNIVHDPKSKDHRASVPRQVLSTPLRTVQHRRYDPTPEPRQSIGNCTMVAECMMGNTVNNRIRGEVLDMEIADKGYARATQLDPWPYEYPPHDTGSSGLAAAKAAVEIGISTKYEWYFGVEHILQGLQTRPISFGGYWYYDMFNATKDKPLVTPTGGKAGGHQWVLSGYNAERELIVGECWWGAGFGINGRFYMTVPQFRILVEDDGDAHFSVRARKISSRAQKPKE